MSEPVTCERIGAVGVLTFARPETMNALDLRTKESLLAGVRDLADDDAVRCVLLRGSGRGFCVGQDLREHAALLAAGDPMLFRTVPEHYNPVALALATMPKPVVAQVNGVAAGAGASFTFAADLRLVADDAGFNLAFTAAGLSADSGASWWLPRLIGTGRAMDLLLRPRTIGAPEALAMGLATEVVPAAELAERAITVATELAAGPTAAYAAVRRAVAFSATHDLADSLDHEADLMAATGATQDHREAVTAFGQKRSGAYIGR